MANCIHCGQANASKAHENSHLEYWECSACEFTTNSKHKKTAHNASDGHQMAKKIGAPRQLVGGLPLLRPSIVMLQRVQFVPTITSDGMAQTEEAASAEASTQTMDDSTDTLLNDDLFPSLDDEEIHQCIQWMMEDTPTTITPPPGPPSPTDGNEAEEIQQYLQWLTEDNEATATSPSRPSPIIDDVAENTTDLRRPDTPYPQPDELLLRELEELLVFPESH